MNSGVVTIIGRPSAGKSTFLNTASGEKVSIVSAIPQTTRNAIRGIVNTTKGQIVFIDTPGYHKSEKKLNLKLQEIAKTRLEEGDAVLYLIDLSREFGEEEKKYLFSSYPPAKQNRNRPKQSRPQILESRPCKKRAFKPLTRYSARKNL